MSDALLTQSVIDRLKSAATRSCWEASLTANMKPGRSVRTAAPRPRRRYLTHRAPPAIITAATLVNGIGDPIELAGVGATW